MIAPMAVDGGTHWLSDFAGVGKGFRYTNGWLAALTGDLLPSSLLRGEWGWLLQFLDAADHGAPVRAGSGLAGVSVAGPLVGTQ